MLVVVAPGQGSQAPGFLAPWLEDDAFSARLEWLSTVAGLDLVHYGTKADADTIKDTAIAQPLLVASGLVAALSLFPHPADAFAKVGAAAGHSVGEITAAAGAGVITAEQAMVFVRERGRAMADAAAKTPTGMTAVLGGDPDVVIKHLANLGLTAANVNGGGQIVAAGTQAQLDALADDPPENARLRPLAVAGAFHTEHMAPAADVLRRHARSISTHDSRTRLLSNRDGQVVHHGPAVLDRLVKQVANPVRWDLCQDTMRDLGVTGLLEVPPAGTLTGLARRALKGVETFALKTPDQLDDARAFVDQHAALNPLENSMSSSPSWRVVVSPMKGTFKAAALDVGRALDLGHTIGTVSSLRDSLELTAQHGGTVLEWLVEDGDPVAPGQPLLRLHPEVPSEASIEPVSAETRSP
jgi:[acyl-carrier-protein] S-malonyltransferase